MAITISFGVQKGGVGKTTTTGIISFLLAKKHKVLAVDFDSQGNLTQMLTQKPLTHFEDRTVLEALKNGDPVPYIHTATDQLHLLPADDYLATFSRFLYEDYQGERTKALRKILALVHDQYDYIVIDLPPNLGDQTINGFIASDYVVAMLQSEPFCYDALSRFIETLEYAQENIHPDLELIGILPSMMNTRTVIDDSIIQQARKKYGDLVFNTIIKRKNRLKEFSILGISDETKADREALQPYTDFLKELMGRVKKKENI